MRQGLLGAGSFIASEEESQLLVIGVTSISF